MSRPKLFAMPSRAELKRAALLSLVVTLVSLAWPVWVTRSWARARP